MEDILDSIGRGEILSVTSDVISVERDSRSRVFNSYGSPINARGNIGFEDYFQTALFCSVDTQRTFHISGYSCAKIMILAPKETQRNLV